MGQEVKNGITKRALKSSSLVISFSYQDTYKLTGNYEIESSFFHMGLTSIYFWNLFDSDNWQSSIHLSEFTLEGFL